MPENVFFASRTRLTDELTKVLRDEIISGRREPGERLPTEQQLSHTYGVSRAVVREAISKLKYDGLVETRQGLGAFVGSTGRSTAFRIEGGELDQQELGLIFELRTTVEVEVAALAAQRRTPEDLDSIERALGEIQQAIEAGEVGADADAAFHMAIADAAANHYFKEFMEFLESRIRTSISVARRNSARFAGWGARVQDEHRAVWDAIKAGDEEAARTAMRAHLVNAADRLGLRVAH